MTAPLRVVAVSGSLHEPSKTTALLRAITAAVAERAPVDARLIELTQIGPSLAGALRRDQLPPEVEASLQAIETADLLIVGSPVYRASFTGLFKHLFDFVDQYALVGTPVLLAATGGGERHALMIEHQLRPLFAFFQALTLPLGVYASTTDFDGYDVATEVLRSRIALAADRALPLVGYTATRPAGLLVG
ncbi:MULTISPECIES: FMN reductase [Microbacterium]|uniref:FMN reductase n=1 Tax=Microbacterium TaxID=33882 RepID=UPI0011EAB30A|nr:MULTISPECIES: FMN reductase [Microbacterium]